MQHSNDGANAMSAERDELKKRLEESLAMAEKATPGPWDRIWVQGPCGDKESVPDGSVYSSRGSEVPDGWGAFLLPPECGYDEDDEDEDELLIGTARNFATADLVFVEASRTRWPADARTALELLAAQAES